MTRTPVPLLIAVCAVFLLAACGQDPGTGGTADPGKAEAGDGGADDRYRVQATVLEDASHGPQLCDAVAESHPPKCGGPDVVGWDWSAVDAASARGTTWGSFSLVGTWDGKRFTLTGKPAPAAPQPPPGSEPDLTTPCPEPDGGWRAPDPAKADDTARDRARQRAAALDGYAGSWVDGDVLNLRFTGDVDRAEREVRRTWGGPVCVTAAEYSEAELSRIQRRIDTGVPNLRASAVDPARNAVTARVTVATPALQRELDERHGRDAVVLESWFQPAE